MATDTNKRTVLFVDDRAKRIDWAIRQYYENSNLIIAPNVPEALRALSSRVWHSNDIISLDHDLNGHDFQSTWDEGSGMHIVKYLKDSGWRFPSNDMPKFYIHTSNMLAAQLMMEDLTMMGLHPEHRMVNYEEA